jgi:hypothetical protein
MVAKLNAVLLVGGALSFVAASLHLACIAGGSEWYRALGAGPQIANMAARGHWYPTTMAIFIASVLSVWGLYAWSGAGVVRRLPFLRLALIVITAIYLLRGLLFSPMQAYFPGNSTPFWYVSSAICLAIGLLHLLGLRQAWPRLSKRAA